MKINTTFFLIRQASQVLPPSVPARKSRWEFQGAKEKARKETANRSPGTMRDRCLGPGRVGRLLLKKGAHGKHRCKENHRLMNTSCVSARGGQGRIQPIGGTSREAYCSHPSLQFLPTPWRDLLNWFHFCGPQDETSSIVAFKGWFCLSKE